MDVTCARQLACKASRLSGVMTSGGIGASAEEAVDVVGADAGIDGWVDVEDDAGDDTLDIGRGAEDRRCFGGSWAASGRVVGDG